MTTERAMEPAYCYITKTALGCGEFSVQGRTADGRIIFGFRTFNSWEIQDKARAYTPSRFIPVFDRSAAPAVQ